MVRRRTRFGFSIFTLILHILHNRHLPSVPESPIAIAAFDPTSPEGRTDITQPPPGERLDANSDRLNYRAAYRNLGSSESIVLNQTARLSIDPYRAGVRLYELRSTGGAFAVTEQSTIGDVNSSRWIGSAAEDNQGNLAGRLQLRDRHDAAGYSLHRAASLATRQECFATRERSSTAPACKRLSAGGGAITAG
jgi:hypothetical protein